MKLSNNEREMYCLFCVHHQHGSYDDNEGCSTHHGTLNFRTLEKNGFCRYKATPEEYKKICLEKEERIKNIYKTIDSFFDDVEYLQGRYNDVRNKGIDVIKYIFMNYVTGDKIYAEYKEENDTKTE